MKYYYCTGSNGSVLECEDGQSADTVGSDDQDYFDQLDEMADGDPNAEWQTSPILSQFSEIEMQEYVGA